MMIRTKGWCWNLNSLLTSDSGSPPTHVFCSSLGFKIGKFGLIKSLRFGLVKSKNSPILSRSDFCASSHPGVHPHMSCNVLLEEANRVTNRGFPLVEPPCLPRSHWSAGSAAAGQLASSWIPSSSSLWPEPSLVWALPLLFVLLSKEFQWLLVWSRQIGVSVIRSRRKTPGTDIYTFSFQCIAMYPTIR